MNVLNASRNFEREIIDQQSFFNISSLTDRNILNKIFNDLERSEKTDNQRLEEKALEEFQ